ncbi:MAG: hypothetical protein ABGW84_04235 [Sphingomonadaceae bacterium]
MSEETLTTGANGNVSDELRGALQRCDQALSSSAPVLRHLVANSESSLFHEEVLARVRGMLDHLGTQMLRRYLDTAGHANDEPIPLDRLDALVTALAEDQDLLSHLHALSIEWRLAQRFAERRSTELVLTPLVKELVGSDKPETARLAMAFLTAQARFAQHARRMQVELGELPGELLNFCLTSLRKAVDRQADSRRHVQLAIRSVQDSYDEGHTRHGVGNLLVYDDATRDAALDPEQAGIALFVTALARASGVSRDNATLGVAEGQAPRLGLMLHAAGRDRQQVERTVLLIHPDARLPEGLGEIDQHSALKLLGGNARGVAGK